MSKNLHWLNGVVKARPSSGDATRILHSSEVSQPFPNKFPNPMVPGFPLRKRRQVRVPEGQLRIAQRFNVGEAHAHRLVPKGRLSRSHASVAPSGLVQRLSAPLAK